MAAQLIMVAVAALLIPRFGITGAGLAFVILYTVYWISVATFLGVRYELRIPNSILFLGALTIVGLAAAGYIGTALDEHTLSGAGARAAVYLLWATVIWLLLDPPERRTVRTAVSRLLRR